MGVGILGSRTGWADRMGFFFLIVRLEVALGRTGKVWEHGLLSLLCRQKKCWGPGSSPLTRAAAEQEGGGGVGSGGACAALGERPDCPVAESRFKAAESAGIRRRGL